MASVSGSVDSQDYPWPRFWVERGKPFDLSPEGYLLDPISIEHDLNKVKLLTTEEIEAFSCLALLGEPGIGKTSALNRNQLAVDTKIRNAGGETLRLRLRSISTDERFITKLFQSQEFRDWIDNKHVLHVFLDDFDECRLRVETLETLLIEELESLPLDAVRNRLRLRIACRTLDWSHSFEKSLVGLWGSDEFRAFELAPLRELDVAVAAGIEGFDPPEDFLNEVKRAEVSALASRPITLKLLMQLYGESGSLPSERTKLYETGCLHLVRESNEHRTRGGRRGSLTVKQRFAVASRIAAATILTGRQEIADGVGLEPSDGKILVSELAGRSEIASEDAFNVDESAVIESLSTSLFTGWGVGSVGWAHRSLGEFLAATYLNRAEVALPQILSLLTHPRDPKGMIAPQLREVAAWLASLRSDVFQELLKVDPRTLLLSDVGSFSDQQRADLVDALFVEHSAGVLVDRDWDLRRRYHKLAHPELATQLRPFLLDQSHSEAQRLLAVSVVQSCSLAALDNDLVQLALDIDESYEIRCAAAVALVKTRDKAARVRLKPLITTPFEDDPDENLKGASLQATWPAHLPAEELFSALTPPRSMVFGLYHEFLNSDQFSSLGRDDVCAALSWVSSQAREGEEPYEFRTFISSIMRRGWELLDESTVLSAFSEAVVQRILRGQETSWTWSAPETSVPLQTQSRRRLVLEEVLPHLPASLPNLLELHACGLVECEDASWLYVHLTEEHSPHVSRRWIDLVDAHCRTPIVEEDSQDNDVQSSSTSDLQNQVQEHLSRFGEKDLDAWPLLIQALFADPSGDISNQFQLDLTDSLGWQAVDEGTKARILDVAEEYLYLRVPRPDKWVGLDSASQLVYEEDDTAGYQSFALLQRSSPQTVESLRLDVWERWAPVLVGHRNLGDASFETLQQELVGLAYKAVPEVVTRTALNLFVLQHEWNSEAILRRVSTAMDASLAKAFVEELRHLDPTPSTVAFTLPVLIGPGGDEVRAYASDVINHHASNDPNARALAVVAAQALIHQAPDAGWPIVWPDIRKDTPFGKQVISGVAFASRRYGSVFYKLREEDLGELFIWMAQNIPYEEDVPQRGLAETTPERVISRWRDFLLSHLGRRGTSAAVAAISRIADELQHPKWLDRHLAEAREEMHRATWEWPTTTELFQLLGRSDRRLIQNGDQLLAIVIESLQRLEVKLQRQESRAVVDLWNVTRPPTIKSIAQRVVESLLAEISIGESEGFLNDRKWKSQIDSIKNQWHPRDEKLFSDYLKRHLDDDLKDRGLIVNREVQNRPYNITDLQINALLKTFEQGEQDVVSVIVEVKGCWNSNLLTDMKNQLVRRYLASTGINHGLYLVGWFCCHDKKSKKSSDANNCPVSLENARRYFQSQAEEQSCGDVVVKSVILDTSLYAMKNQECNETCGQL